MSNASAAVRFPDGTIRYGIYAGTSDLMYPALFEFIDEAWDHNRTSRMSECGDGIQQVLPVEIYSDYGDGFWWTGTATMTHIVDGIDGYEATSMPIDGKPDWLVWKSRPSCGQLLEGSKSE